MAVSAASQGNATGGCLEGYWRSACAVLSRASLSSRWCTATRALARWMLVASGQSSSGSAETRTAASPAHESATDQSSSSAAIIDSCASANPAMDRVLVASGVAPRAQAHPWRPGCPPVSRAATPNSMALTGYQLSPGESRSKAVRASTSIRSRTGRAQRGPQPGHLAAHFVVLILFHVHPGDRGDRHSRRCAGIAARAAHRRSWPRSRRRRRRAQGGRRTRRRRVAVASPEQRGLRPLCAYRRPYRATSPTAVSTSLATSACPMASSGRPCSAYHAAARRCVTVSSDGLHWRSSASNISPNRRWYRYPVRSASVGSMNTCRRSSSARRTAESVLPSTLSQRAPDSGVSAAVRSRNRTVSKDSYRSTSSRRYSKTNR